MLEWLRTHFLLRRPLSEPRPLLVFAHIPKTAGTALRLFFFDAFGRDNVRWITQAEPYDPTTEDPQKFAVLGGHRRITEYKKLVPDREVIYVAVVRDPLTQMISHFNYVRKLPDHPLHSGDDIRDALRPDALFYRRQQNLQCSYLGQEPTFEAARQRMREERILVASLESIGPLVERLSMLWGVPMPNLKTENVGESGYQDRYRIAEAHDYCREHLQEDTRLFDFVRTRGIYARL